MAGSQLFLGCQDGDQGPDVCQISQDLEDAAKASPELKAIEGALKGNRVVSQMMHTQHNGRGFDGHDQASNQKKSGCTDRTDALRGIEPVRRKAITAATDKMAPLKASAG